MQNPDLGFPVIDVHTHIYEKLAGFGYRGELRAIGNGRARWANGDEVDMLPKEYGDCSFTYQKLIQELDANGVEKAVLLQGSFYGFANEYTFEAQQSYAGRLYGMGVFDPYCLSAPSIMQRLIETFHFRGLKFEMSSYGGFMGYHSGFRLDGGIMQKVFEYAEKKELVVSIDMGSFGDQSFQIESLRKTAVKYKGIRFILEHLFAPSYNQDEQVKQGLSVLAPEENIFFSIAALPYNTFPEPYPFPSAIRYIESAKNIVGIGRILWGSDIPITAVKTPYWDLIRFVKDANILNSNELKAFYYQNAKSLYNL